MSPLCTLPEPSAVAVDEGNTYRSKREIRDWLARAGGEYTYMIELVAAQRVDD